MSMKTLSIQLLKEHLDKSGFHSLYFCDQKQPHISPLSPINLSIKFDINEIFFSKSRNVVCLKNKTCTLTINQIQSICIEKKNGELEIVFFCGNPKLFRKSEVYRLIAS